MTINANALKLLRNPVGQTVPPGAIGMHLVGVTGWDQAGTTPTNTPMQTFGGRSVRVWDTGCTWRRIEMSKGVFDWSRLDAEMAIWTAGGFTDVLFTLGQAPDWATTPAVGSGSYNPNPPNGVQDCADFVTALLTRYPQITAIEHWNEPDLATFWNGTPAQLAAITVAQANAARAVRPSVLSIGACPQSFADRGATLAAYLEALNAAGGQDSIDVVSVHTYVQPREPEYIGYLMGCLKAIARQYGYGSKPIWSTETGWGEYNYLGTYYDTSSAPMVQDQAVSYIVRTMLVSLGAGLARQYFYAADKSFSKLRLIDFAAKGTVLDAGIALAYLTGLFAGATVWPIRDLGDRYAVRIRASDGRWCTATWCRDNSTAAMDTTGASEVRSALGEHLTGSTTYTLSWMPIYIFD